VVSGAQVVRGGLLLATLLLLSSGASAQEFFDLGSINLPDVKIEPTKVPGVPPNLQLSFFIISLSLIPYMIVCCTSYIRVTIMLSYLKSALGSTQALSNQLMMGIVMFITFFIMYPVGERMHSTAVAPYMAGDIEQGEFFVKFTSPVREFMLKQTRDQDLELFCKLGKIRPPKGRKMTYDDVPFRILMPSFIMSEVKTGFFIGFLIYIPFLVVDMVVASVLMSMGMFMISPTTISLPFKLVLFCSLDGWHVLIMGVVRSFNRPEWMGASP
jgi:flagellar biosynthesis protein FliP